MSSLHINGMFGLGDNIMQRAFVAAACEAFDRVFLTTTWPEITQGLATRAGEPVRPVWKSTILRTQRKNAEAWSGGWYKPPGGAHTAAISYGHDMIAKHGSIIRAMEAQAPWSIGKRLSWTMPRPARPRDVAKRYAVVRPVTLRTEWNSRARGPDPRYIQHAIHELKDRGFQVITVADMAPGLEEFVGPEPTGQDMAQHRGEGGIDRLLELVAHADVCVGGVGWIVPMAIAFGRPLFMVGGGMGGHNGPDVITDSRMDLTNFAHALPNNYCRCTNQGHDCPKAIADFEWKLGNWLDCVEGRALRAEMGWRN